MAVIGRSFDELEQKIRRFNSELKSSQVELRAVDKALALDPHNIDMVRNRYALFESQLVLNTDKAEALRQRIAALKMELDNGTISQSNYDTELKTLEQQSRLTEIEISKLEGAISRQNQTVGKTQFNSMTEGMKNAQKQMRSFTSVVGTLMGAFTMGFDIIDRWSELSTVEKVMRSLSLGTMVAASAGLIFKSVWAPLAIGAIVAGIVAATAAMKAASQTLGIETGATLDNMQNDMALSTQTTYESSSYRSIDFNMNVTADGGTAVDRQTAVMVGAELWDRARADQVNEMLGAIVR